MTLHTYFPGAWSEVSLCRGQYLERGRSETQRRTPGALREVWLSYLHVPRGHPRGLILLPLQNPTLHHPGSTPSLPTARLLY